jgi:regulator of sigma E protease
MDNILVVGAVLVAVLIPLVVIHEFGHMLACKSVGISVLEFGIGFPPRALKLFRWGETDFTLNWLPIGGFVMPFGEDFVKPQGDDDIQSFRDQLIERGVENPKSVQQARPIQRIWFLAAGPMANFVAAFALFVIVPLTGQPTRVGDVTITEVIPESQAALRALRPGDMITHINGETFRNSNDLESKLNDFVDANPDAPVTFTIHRELTNQTFDTEIIPVLDPDGPQERVRILEVQSETPAARAGFQNQDLVLAVDGEEIKTLEELVDITADHDGVEIVLTVDRDGEILDIPVTPERLDGDGNPARIGIQINILVVAPAFGFVVDDENVEITTVRHSLPASVEMGASDFREMMSAIAGVPGQIVRGEISGQEARPVSPVGVGQIGAEIVRESDTLVPDILIFAALISVALGLTNLLPIPALDGGRILFVLVEMVRGKPLPPEREGLVHLMGMALLLTLMVVLVANDIINPIELPQ